MINTVHEYFKTKIRTSSISSKVSFDKSDLIPEDKFERKFYQVSINDILNDIDSDYEDLIKRVNVQVLNKLDEIYGNDISKNHVRYLNFCMESLNEIFDKSDFECLNLLEIDKNDQEIIEIVTNNENKEIFDDENINSILEEINQELKEKIRLKIEIEFEKRLIKFKNENLKEIEKNLNFLSTESRKKKAFEEFDFCSKIKNFNMKVLNLFK